MEKVQSFNGLKFTRDEKTGYYLNSTIRKRMHRYVWEFYNGVIPPGTHIHHVDHDRGNNSIENLIAITSSAHHSNHGNERAREYYKEMVDNFNTKARPKAAEWHGSDAGLAWHKQHYDLYKEALREIKEFRCENCGSLFDTINHGSNRFCSNKCRSDWRRKSGIDNETRLCAYCGKQFETNKYSKTRYCSLSCANYANPKRPHIG